ncbi:hypothetical protein SUFG_00068 [Sulfitobacter phage phiCB2047-B]|uniref:Uncharacterized protein n=1 Tax=Sulfitobacter phage phiCB2047-B TaxID=754046 RepID=M4PQQ5_9CAUD|nr:hypothetical protein SUFG_00068 [Sulfitobacter phage phiCB2047-B]AGH07435.1 hypothetical protein SUFG_00068 [Sulfitobacter phage phiCB2047-B]
MNNGNYDFYISDQESKKVITILGYAQIAVLIVLALVIVFAAVKHVKYRTAIELKQLENRSKY